MDEVLYERAGQYITNDDFHSFFYFNQKVYNGPAYSLHRNGKKNEGSYENGLQAGKWTYYNEKGVKNLEESYFSCTENCENSHYKHTCPRKGKVRESKKF